MGLRRKAGRGRRRRFSLNGLAIQLSAFALSFTLVALLVVSGSHAAFVEENDSVANYVPIGAPADEEDPSPRRPAARPAPSPLPAPPAPPVELPADEPEPAPLEVSLSDGDAGSAMYPLGTALVPGVAQERCIAVRYEGIAEAGPVQLYAAGVSGDLAPHLDLRIEVGTDDSGSFGSCAAFRPAETLYSGTLAQFAGAHGDHGSGIPSWMPAGTGDGRSFRFSVAVRDDPAASGRTVSFGFSWETRSA